MEYNICDTGLHSTHNKNLQEKAPYFAKARVDKDKIHQGRTNQLIVEVVERKTNEVIGLYHRNYSSFYRTFHPFFLRGKWYALYSRSYVSTRIMSLPDCQDIGGEDDSDSSGFCPTDYFVPSLHYIDTRHYPECPKHENNLGYAARQGSCVCRFVHKPECPSNTLDSNGIRPWKDCICREEEKQWEDWHMPFVFPDRIHGFVAGCIWGDDTSWKIQYLDLSRADEGILVRSEKFGYLEMPSNLHLDKAVQFEELGPEYGDDSINVKIASEQYYDFKTGKPS